MTHLTPLDQQRQWHEPLANTAITVTPLYITPWSFPKEDLDCMTDVSWLDDQNMKRGILLSQYFSMLAEGPTKPHYSDWSDWMPAIWKRQPLSMEFTRRAWAASYAAWAAILAEVGGPSGVPTLMYYVDGHLCEKENQNG